MILKNMWEAILNWNTQVQKIDYEKLSDELSRELQAEKAKRIAAERERDMAASKLGMNTQGHFAAMRNGANNFRAFKLSTAALCEMVESYSLKADLNSDPALAEIVDQADFLVGQGAKDPDTKFIPFEKRGAGGFIEDGSIRTLEHKESLRRQYE